MHKVASQGEQTSIMALLGEQMKRMHIMALLGEQTKRMHIMALLGEQMKRTHIMAPLGQGLNKEVRKTEAREQEETKANKVGAKTCKVEMKLKY
jgi:hypothetical protein